MPSTDPPSSEDSDDSAPNLRIGNLHIIGSASLDAEPMTTSGGTNPIQSIDDVPAHSAATNSAPTNSAATKPAPTPSEALDRLLSAPEPADERGPVTAKSGTRRTRMPSMAELSLLSVASVAALSAVGLTPLEARWEPALRPAAPVSIEAVVPELATGSATENSQAAGSQAAGSAATVADETGSTEVTEAGDEGPDHLEAGDFGAGDFSTAVAAVSIPAIDVESPIVDLGLRSDGTLEVPTVFELAGWYEKSALPGEPGPTVIVGHVDSTDGPAVFYRLRDLEPGHRIEVERADGAVVGFEVTDVSLVSKDDFPTEAVYGATSAPTLRLITCGGDFDWETASYVGNRIVFAEFTDVSTSGHA